MKSSFTANDFELFKSIAKLPESSLYRGLTSVLKVYYETEPVIVGPENQYVMAKGDIPVMILDGEVDYLPEPAFLNVGTIEEAIEKGKKLLEQAGGKTIKN